MPDCVHATVQPDQPPTVEPHPDLPPRRANGSKLLHVDDSMKPVGELRDPQIQHP